MQNTETARDFKDQAYGAFAGVAGALGSARRLELVDLLVQEPHTVADLAEAVGQSIGNTSQHLQVLRRARLVETTRQGTHITYRLAPGVLEAFVALRRLAEARSDRLAALKASWYTRAGAPQTIDRASLRCALAEGRAVLLDVRPAGEYAHGHLPGARSIPLEELEGRIDELPPDRLVVATCRGPFCVFAAEAVRLLRSRGRAAVRYEEGVAEWAADGGRVAVGGPR